MPQRLTKGWSMIEAGCWIHEDSQWMVSRALSGASKGYYWIHRGKENEFTAHRISGEVVYCQTFIAAQRLVLHLTKWWPKNKASMEGGD